MKYYSVLYKKKGTLQKIEIQKLVNSNIHNFLRQLRMGISTLEGDIIEGLNNLEYFQILERDFVYKEGNNYYVDFEHDTGVELHNGYIELSEYSKLTGIPEEDLLNKIENDVTNQFLYKYNFIGDDFDKLGKVLFKNNIIIAHGYEFKLEEGKKIQELFDLIFRAEEFYKKLSFTYDELKFVYKNSGVQYKELEPYLNKEYVDDILGKKVREIKKKTGMKDKIIENNNGIVSIRQETAS